MAKNKDPEIKIKTMTKEEAMRELLKSGTDNLIFSDGVKDFIKDIDKKNKNAIKLLKTNENIRKATKEIIKSYIVTFDQIIQDTAEQIEELKKEYNITAPEFETIGTRISNEFINDMPFMTYEDEDETDEEIDNILFDLLEESNKELQEEETKERTA